MNLRSLCLLAGALAFLQIPAFADELRESYVARLSDRDHFSSRGERLQSAAAIIRQDRANFYVYRLRDGEDEADSFFANKGNREKLEQMLEHGSSAPTAIRRVVNGTPLINVKVFTDNAGRDYITVTVISD